MEVIRKIVEMDKLRSIIEIPNDFNYSKVEILIMPFEDEIGKASPKFDPKDFYGVSKIENVETAIKEMRDEWDRL